MLEHPVIILTVQIIFKFLSS